jgi:hypothetical protein
MEIPGPASQRPAKQQARLLFSVDTAPPDCMLLPGLMYFGSSISEPSDE